MTHLYLCEGVQDFNHHRPPFLHLLIFRSFFQQFLCKLPFNSIKLVSPQPHLYRCPDGEIFSVNGHKCGKESATHTCQPSEIPPPENVPVGHQPRWPRMTFTQNLITNAMYVSEIKTRILFREKNRTGTV